MRKKLNKFRNEIVDEIEKIVSQSPQKTLVLFDKSNRDETDELLDTNPPPRFTHYHKHGSVTECYLQSLSINKSEVLEFIGVDVDDEVSGKFTEEADWIYVETLVSILEYIKEKK